MGLAEYNSKRTGILIDSGAIGEAETLEFDARWQTDVEIETLEYLVGHMLLIEQ